VTGRGLAAAPLGPPAAALAAGIAGAAWLTLPSPLLLAAAATLLLAALVIAARWPRIAVSLLLLAVAALGALRAAGAPLPADHLARLGLTGTVTIEGRLDQEPVRWASDRTRLLLEADAGVADRDLQRLGLFLAEHRERDLELPRLRLAVLERVETRFDHRQLDLVDLVLAHAHRAGHRGGLLAGDQLHLGSHLQGHRDLFEHGRFHGANTPESAKTSIVSIRLQGQEQLSQIDGEGMDAVFDQEPKEGEDHAG